MPVTVIDTIKPKNQGTFPVVEAVDVKVTNDKRLDAALNDKANQSDLTALSETVSTKAAASDLATTNSTISKMKVYFTPEMFGAATSSADNTEALQNAINQTAASHAILYIDGMYRITAPLYIKGSNLSIIGLTDSCGFMQMTDGEDVLQIQHSYQTGEGSYINLKLKLQYDTLQTTSCAGLKFVSLGNHDGWGFFHNNIDVSFTNCYDCVLTDGIDPVWDCRFSIKAWDMKHSVVKLDSASQLQNYFETITAINTYARNGSINDWSELPTSYAVRLEGQGTIINYLDVEDWNGPIMYAEDVTGSFMINSIHLERVRMRPNQKSMFEIADNTIVNEMFMYNIVFSGDYESWIFDKIANKSLEVSNLNIQLVTNEGQYSPCFLHLQNPAAKCTLKNITATYFRSLIYETNGLDVNTVVDGRTYSDRYQFTSIAGIKRNVRKGETYYASDANTLGYVGWYATATVKNSDELNNVTLTATAYNGELVANQYIMDLIKVGDKIHLTDLNNVIVNVSGTSGNKVYVSNYGQITEGGETRVTYLTNEDVLVPFGAIVTT